MRVELPFTPYLHQRQAHAYRQVMRDAVLEHGRQMEARFLVLVWHRRAGKTVFAVMELFIAALNCPLERGRYAYIAPLLKQARAVAWDYLCLYARAVPGCEISESNLSVRMLNGAEVRLYGADNPDALRGIYLDGVVLDEVADMRPNIWGEIIRPALSDGARAASGQWAIFIGTPKGVNLFSELYFRAQTEPGWKADLRRAVDTGVIPAGELEQAKREMAPSQYAQEYECDFAAAVDDVLMRLDDVLAAQRRAVPEALFKYAPKVLGVDVARYGDGRSCLFPRQGLVAFKPHIFRGLNLMALADQIASVIARWKPDAVFIDAGGMGGGVIDRLLQLNLEVTGVDFGGSAVDERFENKRAEMWWLMAEWCKQGGALPSGNEVVQDLVSPKYTYRNARGRLQLESKDKMRERGLPSPDVGDALACTFAAPVLPRTMVRTLTVTGKAADYDPYTEASP